MHRQCCVLRLVGVHQRKPSSARSKAMVPWCLTGIDLCGWFTSLARTTQGMHLRATNDSHGLRNTSARSHSAEHVLPERRALLTRSRSFALGAVSLLNIILYVCLDDCVAPTYFVVRTVRTVVARASATVFNMVGGSAIFTDVYHNFSFVHNLSDDDDLKLTLRAVYCIW